MQCWVWLGCPEFSTFVKKVLCLTVKNWSLFSIPPTTATTTPLHVSPRYPTDTSYNLEHAYSVPFILPIFKSQLNQGPRMSYRRSWEVRKSVWVHSLWFFSMGLTRLLLEGRFYKLFLLPQDEQLEIFLIIILFGELCPIFLMCLFWMSYFFNYVLKFL